MITLKLIVGLILLVAGAEALVRGASKIAAALGIAPLIIGLTVVSFGTSSPELAVSVSASLNGSADIALGNVIGSNIFNILFILGLCAAIQPLLVNQQLVRLDVPIMIGISLLLLLFAQNGMIEFWEGLILLAVCIGYTGFLIRQSRKEKSKKVLEEYDEEYAEKPEKGKLWLQAIMVFVGLGLLIFGARWLVEAAVSIATALGVSELIIGLTIIAMGTSLPEVATSVIATVKGERDIAVGNVVGSNIYNILLILGVAAILAPGGIKVAESAIEFDLPFMVAVAAACLPIFFTGYKIVRWEGFVFLGYYAAYTIYLVLANMRHASLDVFSTALNWFAVPLTVLTLTILVVREVRRKR